MKKYTKEELFNMNAIEIYKLVLRGDIMKRFPEGFWQGEQGKINSSKCTKYLIEDILKYDDETLKEKMSQKIFSENKLFGMLNSCFGGSAYKALDNAYPNKFKEWEFKVVPNGYWKNKENGIKATKWLIEEKLKLDDEQIKKQLSKKIFKENGLGGMLQYCFNNSPFEAINSTYPNKFKELEFKNVPLSYWNDENRIISEIKWLIEEKLKLSDDELKEKLSIKLFSKNRLSTALSEYFDNSPYKAINSVYPNKFKEWEFNCVPNGYWKNKENGIKATKWLIEEKLQLTDDELKQVLSASLFRINGLSGLLAHCFNNSPYEAINSVYPNVYKKSDFKSYKYSK
ncbi:MAG: hypothetical protein IJH34_10175 [Romboutsia sp.]|nr:hypothetical protein [Romboutsia sp.]